MISIKLFYYLAVLAAILFIVWVVQFDEIRSLERTIDNMKSEQNYNNQFTFIIEGN